MTGLFLYAFTATGLGLLLPGVRLDNRSLVGLRLFGGFCLFILGFPLLHLFFGLSLTASAWALLGLAAIGVARAVGRSIGQAPVITSILHPVPVLLALAAGVIAVHGTPGYLPYASDEFSNWLGAARHIFMAGDYAAVREVVTKPAYTPGWRFGLLYPWVISGGLHEGASTALPLIAHIGLLGLVYDVVARAVYGTGRFDARQTTLFAWGFLGIVMAGEASGLLWTRNLLIEQPQVYTLSVAIIAMWLVASRNQARGVLAAYAGLALATSYFIKIAAITLIPAAVLVALMIYISDRASRPEALKRAALLLAAMVAPLIMVAVLWKLSAPDTGSVLSSPGALFSEDSLKRIAGRDWLELAGRFGAAVWSYVSAYKTPLTLAAVLALGVAAAKGRYQALLIWAAFFIVYTISLYWWHLAGAGDYLYRELNSIERFMRIPVRILHLLGMMAIAVEASAYLGRDRAAPLVDFAKSVPVVRGVSVLVVLLIGLQGVQAFRSLEDMTTRKYQHADPRVAGARDAVRSAVELSGDGRTQPVRLVFISQGKDNEIMDYARYYARRPTPEDPNAMAITLIPGFSWSPTPVNMWQSRADSGHVQRLLRGADMIWPLNLDPWVSDIVRQLPGLNACSEALAEIYMVRQPSGNFSCLSKP